MSFLLVAPRLQRDFIWAAFSAGQRLVEQHGVVAVLEQVELALG